LFMFAFSSGWLWFPLSELLHAQNSNRTWEQPGRKRGWRVGKRFLGNCFHIFLVLYSEKSFRGDEWRQFFGDVPYHLTCENLPEGK
jgi:hypothetical protein